MGQQGAVLIHPVGGLDDLGARKAQAALLDHGHRLVGDVAGKGEAVAGAEILQLHLVAHAGQDPLPPGVVVLQLVALHQLCHHLIGGGVLLQLDVLFQLGQPALGGGVVPVGEGVVAAFVRAAHGHGVVPFLAAALQNLHQIHHQLVHVAGEHQLIDYKVVAHRVGSKGAAVTVHDLAPGGGDVEFIVGHALGLAFVFLAVHQLEFHQPQQDNAQHHKADPDQSAHAAEHAFLVHRPASLPVTVRARNARPPGAPPSWPGAKAPPCRSPWAAPWSGTAPSPRCNRASGSRT